MDLMLECLCLRGVLESDLGSNAGFGMSFEANDLTF